MTGNTRLAANDPDIPPVTLKQRRVAFENSRFRVFSDHVLDSHGVEVENYLVVAPHSPREDLITGVSIIPLWDGRLVLLRTFRHAVRRFVLEAPRGFVDPHENPRDAALRELSEETGLRCSPDRLISLGFCAPEASTLAARIALYAATDCYPGGHIDREEMGLGERLCFTLSEAERLMREMSLEDATTALALHRFMMMNPVTQDALR